MSQLSEQLKQLRENEPDVALIMDTYRAISRVYSESLEAMGRTTKIESVVSNSADVILSIRPMPTTFDD